MSQFTIDVDAEAVFLDGAWYTREDLSRRIKAMLDEGDFNVATPSLALQELTQTMQGIRTLAFRCTPELAEALGHLAARLGQSVGALVREAATQYVTDANSAPVQHPSLTVVDAPVRAAPPSPPPPPQDAVIQARVPTNSTQEDLPKVIVDQPHVVIAGPGALKAAGVVTEAPSELKGSSTVAANESASSEHRWFKQ